MLKTDARFDWALLSGPVAALVAGLAAALLTNVPGEAVLVLAITTLTVIWWVTQALPMGITALAPIALFPLLGVMDGSAVAGAVGSPIILLMLGGFMLSKAMEYSNTHRQLALLALHWVGHGTERRLVIGFMVASAALSMWISNTATTLMLLPVALAVLQGQGDRLAIPLMLGIAYAASIGGIGTPVGTPPNLIFMQVYKDLTGSGIGFGQWMAWALPVVAVLLPLAMLWLTRGLGRPLQVTVPPVGDWTVAQRRVLWVFAATVVAWVTRKEPFGGWSGWLGLPTANDASVALLAVLALFVVPDGQKGRLLDWDSAKAIPWHILLMFAGGICIARAFSSSGLSGEIGTLLQQLEALPLWLLLLGLCLSVTLLTELTSNMATASLLMPVLGATALAMGLAPAQLMVPAVICCSTAFMLPIATAPNAIVYSAPQITVQRMAREGAILSVLAATVTALAGWALIGT